MKKNTIWTLLLILASFGSCKRDDDVYAIGSVHGPTVAGIISIKSLSALSVEADSLSPCFISVQIDPNTDSLYRPITFHSSNGSFPNGRSTDTAIADAYGTATLPLISNSAGPALISASVKTISFNVDTSITFTEALPDDFILTADKYKGGVTDSFNVSCALYRNPGRGRVTDPVKVFFSATPDSSKGTSNLVLAPFGYSARGSVKIWVKNPYGKTGTFVITSTALSDKGDSLRQNVTLLIQ
jgi:hypothetical protein